MLCSVNYSDNNILIISFVHNLQKIKKYWTNTYYTIMVIVYFSFRTIKDLNLTLFKYPLLNFDLYCYKTLMNSAW